MTTSTILALLESHGVDYRLEGRRIIAQDNFIRDGESYFEDVDVTDWSYEHIMGWLGY